MIFFSSVIINILFFLTKDSSYYSSTFRIEPTFLFIFKVFKHPHRDITNLLLCHDPNAKLFVNKKIQNFKKIVFCIAFLTVNV